MALITVNYRDPRPIYEQVKDGLKTLIITGAIAPGKKMPSVRALSSQLSINPNTIQRAYRELELEKFIYTVPGKGSFAGDDVEVDQGHLRDLYSQLDKVVTELVFMGEPREKLASRIIEGGNSHD